MGSGNHLFDANSGMQVQAPRHWERRDFVKGVAALAGAAGLSAYDATSSAAEPPPEITRIRLDAFPITCIAPQYVAEELLKAEGFTDVQYPVFDGSVGENVVGAGKVDMDLYAAAPLVTSLDAGAAVVILAGVHLGCLDPRRDINWIVHSSAEGMKLLEEGKVDAFLGFPPEPQELRAKKVGRVIVNTAIDKPWSQYYCCMLIANRDFAQKHPVATKRAVRAVLKAADLCAQQPERAARLLIEKGFAKNYEFALQTLREVRYDAWREYDPDNTIRFHALRLHEVGMIKSSPQKIIAQGTDWRFLNELKRELKA